MAAVLCKQQWSNRMPSTLTVQPSVISVKFTSDGWSSSLARMPMFTRAEMNMHISKSGKSLDPQSKVHFVPTSMRKAKTFLDDEYFKDISAASDQVHFFFKSSCYHSFRKNDPPHSLKVALDLVTGEVRNASCTCVAGQVGFCNHILALLMKLCKFSLYSARMFLSLMRMTTCCPRRLALQPFNYGTARGEGIRYTRSLLQTLQ